MRNIVIRSSWPDVDPDLENLLHPAAAFEHPQAVIDDPDLTLAEKRAILSAWASDACAVEAQPGLRLAPGAKQPVRFDDVVDALRRLDSGPPPKWKRVLRDRARGNENRGGGLSLA